MTDYPFLSSPAEFSLIHFQIEFQEPFQVSLERLLRLRRDLRSSARQVLGGADAERFLSLFDPPLPADPFALRRFQRAAPPFVLFPDPEQEGEFDSGDGTSLRVVFWGKGIQSIGDFARVLSALGKTGFHRGEGRFELSGMEAEDLAGNRSQLWRPGLDLSRLAPPVNDLRWWMERFDQPSEARLEFLTPARLISQGRPLFRVSFQRLFPFILRRVGSMFYAHCGCELIGDAGQLLEAARAVQETGNRLRWEDWRTLEGPDLAQDIGGVAGSVHLSGDGIEKVMWVLRAGTLLNVGKGAAFGSGRYRLTAA